jgi:hypothetical protein
MVNFARAGVIIILILAILFGLTLYAWANFDPSNITVQAGLQRARSQRIAKDVLILADKPTDEEKAAAINELQLQLDGWEKTQAGLRQGDPDLGLPRSVPADVSLVLNQAQPDYIAITTATKAILAAKEKPPDPVQVDIILSHERSYYLAMSQVVMLWQAQLDARRWQFFYIEGSALTAIAVIVICMHRFLTMRAIHEHNYKNTESKE